LVESIRNDQNTINDLSGQLGQIDNALQSLQSAMDIIQRLFAYTAALTTFWAALTTKVHTAASLWIILEKLPAQEMERAKQTWDAINQASGDWS